MRVLISGASGFLGQALTRALQLAGHQVVALVRRSPRADQMPWDPEQPLDPTKLAGRDAVVHLAGKNIAGRWTEKFKQQVLDSRVHGTRTLATAAAESFRRSGQPRVFVSASAAGYYGDRGDELLPRRARRARDFWPRSASSGRRRQLRRAMPVCAWCCASEWCWDETAAR